MQIGLIDVDGHNFPSLPLMKLSAWHKQQGDDVGWYEPLFSDHMDIVYMSKVFSFTPDYEYYVNSDQVIKGGTGYYYPDGGEPLTDEIEHIYPDYSIYPQFSNIAYGFLARGCPRNCHFCIVGKKEGLKSYKVADLKEFWQGQRHIKLLDPNLLACKNHMELLQQLKDSGAYIDFTQGLDARLLTEENTNMINELKIKRVHFAWDNYNDMNIILEKLKQFKALTGWDRRKMTVYILTNFNTTFDQDLERVYRLKEIGFDPYVMIFEKDKLRKGSRLRKLQRWVNSPILFATVKRFEEYTA